MDDYSGLELDEMNRADMDEQHQDQDDDHEVFQDNEAGTTSRRGMLSGTGLSSDSEDADASEAENGSGVPQGGDEGAGESSGDDGGGDDGGGDQPGSNVKAAMKDLFGEDDDDEDEDEDEDEGPEEGGGGGESGTREGGGGGGGSGGRYGTGGGDGSSDDDIFDDRGRIRGGDGDGAASSAAGGEGSQRSKHASSASALGSDSEDGGEGEGGDEEEEAPPALPDRELRIPVLPRPPPGADVMISRLPNILGFKTEAFDPDTFDEAAEAAQFKFTTNIIRWRYKRENLGRLELGEDGEPLRETNSRLVKWSDGSTQLLVGDEAFDVEEQSIDRSALFVQQMAPEGSMLQCQGELTKKISFKPSNVLSKAHRTLTLAVRKRAVKGSRIQKYAETIDPEQVKQERARAQEAENKQARRRNREYARHTGDWRYGRGTAMDIGYLEAGAASGTYDDTSTRAIKSDSRAGRYDRSDEEEEEDDEDEDEITQLAQLRAKRAAAGSSNANSNSSKRGAFGTDDSDADEVGDAMGPSSGGGKGKASARGGGDDSDEEEEDEDAGEGLVGAKRPRSDYDEEEESTRGPTGKRMNRIEDSDSE